VSYQVIPSQPTAKNELNTNRNTAATMPVVVLTFAVMAARTAMDAAWPVAPKSISGRRPNLSMVKMAIQEAMKYSVPFKAASKRLRNPESPMLFSNMVAA
jgi:uncharacterized protein YqjF (DUF2071 family)